jgi:SAM-dependent methyltransferase
MAEILDDTDRTKVDSRDDTAFYDSPRFVTHADDAFLARLTELYDDLLADGDDVLDAMSSWVSHLPDRPLGRVVGHGLNEAELKENDALDEYFVQNLNADRQLPFADEAFDAVLCALSVQYLQYPGEVFGEFHRVLEPGGVLVVSFSNRMFPTKAVRAWRERSMDGRAELVSSYARSAGFAEPTVVRERPDTDPFYAVVARRD